MEWPVVHIVNNITASVFKGIEEAIVERNSMMHMCDKPAIISKYNMEMFLILKFLDVILVPNLSSLDLRNRLQPVRNHYYKKLSDLTSLQIINLADASHGYISNTMESYQKQFLTGIKEMKRLVSFTLHFDCYDELISCLSENCNGTLKMLDIESSKQVTDSCIEDITSFNKLCELNIFACGFSGEGQAKILTGLRNLSSLKRGDFLCEALDWAEWLKLGEASEVQKFALGEFFYSENYHFHTVDQMKLVAKYCPNIYRMRFMFGKEYFVTFQNLSVFKNLKELHLCGGEFYSGKKILNISCF